MRQKIIALVESINPYDDLEGLQIKEALDWLLSEAEIFRLEKPAIPAKHLVAYFMLIDRIEKKILLVDHKKAELWLPSGGHVEPGEHPHFTVEREIEEELRCEAKFIYEVPFFLTITSTVGQGITHTDVSLWYLMEGNIHQPLNFDQREFYRIQWFAFDDVPYSRTDPHMKRFIKKLKTTLF